MTLRKDLNNSPYTKTTGSNEFTCDTHAHYPINPDTLLNFLRLLPLHRSSDSRSVKYPL